MAGIRHVGKGTLPIESGYSEPSIDPDGREANRSFPSGGAFEEGTRAPSSAHPASPWTVFGGDPEGLADGTTPPAPVGLENFDGGAGAVMPATVDFVFLMDGTAKLGAHIVQLSPPELRVVRSTVAEAIARTLRAEAERVIASEMQSLQPEDSSAVQVLPDVSG